MGVETRRIQDEGRHEVALSFVRKEEEKKCLSKAATDGIPTI